MCNIALIPDTVSAETAYELALALETDSGGDGAGVAWVDAATGRLSMAKSPKGVKKLKGVFRRLSSAGWRGFLLVHTRKASAGNKDYDSTQPMACGDGWFAYKGHSDEAVALGKALKHFGVNLATGTDTEVMAELYKRGGVEAVKDVFDRGAMVILRRDEVEIMARGYCLLKAAKTDDGSYIISSEFPYELRDKQLRIRNIYDCEEDGPNIDSEAFSAKVFHSDTKKLRVMQGKLDEDTYCGVRAPRSQPPYMYV